VSIHILGITAYRRDSAAALIRDGELVAAAREESFSRCGGDAAFPTAAIEYCLREADLSPGAIDLVVYCDVLQSGGGVRSLVTALRRTQLQVMLRRGLAALLGSGRHALPPLTLVTRQQAQAELSALVELQSDLAVGETSRADDAACAIGAALHGWHQQLDRAPQGARAPLPWLGPWFGSGGVCAWLDELGVTYRRLDDEVLCETVAQRLASGVVVGWMQGRLEFCRRSFGGRSILVAPQSPLLPALLDRSGAQPLLLTLDRQHARTWLETAADLRVKLTPPDENSFHLVDADRQPRLHQLLLRLARSGIPLLVSVDLRTGDEPLVATPVDAYRCFLRSDLDALVIEDVLLLRAQQPLWDESLLPDH